MTLICAFMLATFAGQPAMAANTVTPVQVTTLNVPSSTLSKSVADKAKLLDGHATRDLRQSIREAEARTASEIKVVTLASIGGRQPKAFATGLFNKLHVGKGKPGGGVLVLIIKDAQRIEIAVSSKLNRVVSHSWTESMLQREVLPHLRQNAYGVGLTRSVEAVARRLANPDARTSENTASDAVMVVGVGTCFAIGTSVQAHADRRSRKCKVCGEIVPKRNVYPWEVVDEATDRKAGTKERKLYCECGAVGTQRRTIPRYDARRRRRDGTWEYYNYGSSDSGGGGDSCDGGGGGGGDF